MFVPEIINEVEEDDEDDLFSFIDDLKFDDISGSISSDIDDLLPEVSEVIDEADDLIDDDDDDFEGFKIDLDSIEDINSDDDDEEDFVSLFDSMFDD